MTEASDARKDRYLVVHDYGMGGLWWWVRARSPREIVETYAEVEVVTNPDTVHRAHEWSLKEIDIDDTRPNQLASHRKQRDAQRGQSGFGALIGRERVYLRWVEDELEPGPQWLIELEPSGRWIRQVEQHPNGEGVRSRTEDWPLNPPLDLYDPKLAAMEISSEDFEGAWSLAREEVSA